MLDKLSKFFSVSEECEQDIEKLIRLATASLLVEVVRADFERDISEEKTMATQLEKILNIPFSDATKIISSAEDQVEKSTSLYEFTNLINEHCSIKQKLSLLRSMWRVAYADENVDRYEEHLIRRVAELIHVNHSQYIKAKVEASEPESG